jgi:transcriptional regulator with XRE-family HTH domain
MAFPRDVQRSTKFAAWLKKHMEECGYKKQGDLFRASGISRASISRMLSEGQIPDEETIVKLAPALGKSVSEVLIAAGYPVNEQKKISSSDIYEITFFSKKHLWPLIRSAAITQHGNDIDFINYIDHLNEQPPEQQLPILIDIIKKLNLDITKNTQTSTQSTQISDVLKKIKSLSAHERKALIHLMIDDSFDLTNS